MTHLTRAIVLVSLIVVLAPQASSAAKVKVWHHAATADFARAECRQVVINSEGTIALARQLQPLAALSTERVWDMVEDKHGNLLVATGDNGKIYKIAPTGEVSVAYQASDGQVLCLALAGNGNVYAGTGPSGSIVCLPATGKARVVADRLGSYVWCMVLDPESDTLYAGTGPKGRIYQVTPDGKATVFYQTKQEHILSLARGPESMLYAGTNKGGLVYRINPQGKGFVLYSAPQAEVRSLLVTSAGVYAGTSVPTKREVGGGSLASEGGSSSPLSALKATPLGTDAPRNKLNIIKVSRSTEISSSDDDKDSKSSAAAAPSLPSSGENSLYCIAHDGTVRELYRDKTMVLSMLRQQGSMLLGTGMNGQIFEVNEQSRESTEVARLEHGQVQCLLQRRDGSIVVGTGDPGKLYVLKRQLASKGTVTSPVLDAKILSKWGALTWNAETPPGTTVSLAVRSGNVADPDDTWSDWSAEQTDPQQAKIAAPTARFLQYRISLASSARLSPALRNVTLRYQTTNHAPDVTKVEVPNLDADNLDTPRKLKLKWTAVDPNEDELVYSVYIRKDGWQNWVRLEDDLTKKEYEWDTATTPTGTYQVKIVASDRRDNTQEDALTGERISAAFPVSHTPPQVSVRFAGLEGDRAVLEGQASDPLLRLTSASYAVNGKEWTSVFPQDGIFDSKSEAFRFKTEALTPGSYVVVLRVRDAAGNVGTSDVVFTVKERK